MYATPYCGDTRLARRVLDEMQIVYDFIDFRQDPAAARFVEEINNGFRSSPTIIFPDGSVLVEPSERELRARVGELQAAGLCGLADSVQASGCVLTAPVTLRSSFEQIPMLCRTSYANWRSNANSWRNRGWRHQVRLRRRHRPGRCSLRNPFPYDDTGGNHRPGHRLLRRPGKTRRVGRDWHRLVWPG